MEAIVISYALKIIAVSSLVHIFAPPYDVFSDFPVFQKYYKLFVEVVGYIALNARGKMIQAYPSVSKPAADTPPTP